MLEILAGRSGSGKTREMYLQMEQCLKAGEENLILLVPEQYTLEAEKELMEVLDLRGFFQLEVLGFNRLMDDLVNTSLEPDKTVITETGKGMILKRILREEKESLLAFGSMVDKSGFVEELGNAFRSFKENMVEPRMLQQFVDDGGKTGMLERKVLDMVRIFQGYQQYMEKGYTDNEQKIQDAINLVGSSPRIRESRVWIHGFHTFTLQMFHFIKALAQQAKSVVVTLDVNGEEDAWDEEIFQINRKTLDTFRSMWEEKLRVRFFSPQETGESPLEHLRREFFSYPYKKWTQEVSRIHVLETQNVYQEIDFAVKEVAALVRDKGWSYKDVGIVVNDLNGYGFPIQRTMEEYGIPCFLDAKRSMADKPLCLFVVSSLQVLVKNYRYEDVFSMLKTGFSALGPDEWEALENYCLQFGIRGGQWKSAFHKSNPQTDTSLEVLNEYRERITGSLEKLKRKVKDTPTFSSMARALYDYLEENRSMEKTRELASELQRKGDLEHASENSQVFNRVMELLDELVEVFGDEKTDLKEFSEVLKQGISASQLGILPASGDEVIIGDVKRTRQRSLSAVFVLGVNEGILPGEGEKVGLFTNQEGKRLEEARIPVFRDPTYQGIQEKYLFHLLLSKPAEKIYFSCAQADFEGNTMRPSFYMKRLMELFPGIAIDAGKQDAMSWITNARGTLRPMIAHLRQSIDNGSFEADSHWKSVFQWYMGQEAWQSKMEQLMHAVAYTNKVDRLPKNLIHALYGKTIKSSVTSLETYGQCPFRYFVRYGLKPERRPIYEVSIPDMGELLHDSLQEYTKKLQGEKRDWTEVKEEEQAHICSAIVESKIRGYREGVFASKGRYQYLAYYLNRLLVRAVQVLTYHMSKGSFRLEKSEAAFGENREFAPVVFHYDDDVRMVLEGRIDRVDVFRSGDETFIKIIDYKTGEKTLELKDVYYGLTLQLLVYLQVCLENRKDSSPAGAFYFKLDDPMIKGFSFESENIENKIKDKLRLLGLLVKKMEVVGALDRDIDQKPGDSDVVYCKVKKDGDFGKGTRGLIDEKVFDRILSHTMDMAKSMGRGIVEGHIAVSPVKNDGKAACRFCDYKTVYQFDELFKENRYRIRRKMKDEEVVNRLMGGSEDE